MDLISESPSSDLISDMIKEDNEMLENEEQCQQEAQPVVSPSAAKQTDNEKVESMHHEIFPCETYEEQQSPKEITVSNPSNAGVILNTNSENVTLLEPAFQDFSGDKVIDSDENNKEIQLADHADPSNDTLNPHEFEDVLYKPDEKVYLSSCDEIQQKFETICILPSTDIQAIQDFSSTNQTLETGTNIYMVEKLKIEIDEEEMALLNNLTTANERFSLGILQSDSAVFKVKEKLYDKWSKVYKSFAGVSNLPAIISPDQTLVKKQEKSPTGNNESDTQANKKLWKTNKRKTSVSCENLGGNLAQSIEPEKRSSLFSEKNQTSSNESYTKDNKNWWKTSKRHRIVSSKNLGGNLDQISIKKTEKGSFMFPEKSQTSSNEIHIKNWWKTKKSETSVSLEDLGGTSRLDQTPIIKPEKSSSLFPEKSQTSSNEIHIKNWWKTKKSETSVSLEDLGGTSRLNQTPIIKPEKSCCLFPEKSQTSGNESLALVNKNWWKTKKPEKSVSLENFGATSSLEETSTKKLEKSTSFSSKKSEVDSDNDSAQDKMREIAKRETSVLLENPSGNLDQALSTLSNKTEKSYSLSPKKNQTSTNKSQDLPINKMIRSSKESSSELLIDENESCQLQMMKDQETQTVDTDHTKDNLDVAVDVKDEATQTDKEIKNILSFCSCI